jgi:ribonuclease P protein component
MFGRPNTAGSTRLGITVTRKTAGAVMRNRIKRRLRDVFRRHRRSLEPPFDVVINARRSIIDTGAAELEAELLQAFRRLVRKSGSEPS